MKQELISIIIPVYNVAPYLREALDSVVTQSYKKLEIIVVDDGSTDESGAICDEYKSDPRVIVIHQENQGVSNARNAGLDIATGDYIAFLDPDDAFHPSFMQTMHDTILREKCDIVICKFKAYHTTKKMNVNEGEAIYPSCESGKYNRTQALNLLYGDVLLLVIWNKIYKRELWNGVRFHSQLRAASDHLASYQVFDRCNLAYMIDTPLYLNRRRSGSISRTFSPQNIECQIRARLYVSDFLRSHSPEIFSEQQIRNYDRTLFYLTVINYAKYYKKNGSEYLKEQINDIAGKVGIKDCGFKMRTAYYIMLHCPWMLKYAYPAYSKIRGFVKNITGR